MIECVINISEGRDHVLVAQVASRAGATCLDVHSDPWHNRSVLTLAGADTFESALEVARATVELCDYRGHEGVHPSLGVLDVVPFVPLGTTGSGAEVDLTSAVALRDAFIARLSAELAVPCFAYGPERSLPEVRRRAFVDLDPDGGPSAPHATAGAACVGARPVLVAYNLYLVEADLALARRIATEIRSPAVRALGLAVGAEVQVSTNLLQPLEVGPADLVDVVSTLAPVSHAELVGLVPDAVLRTVPRARWSECDLTADRTIEARLSGSTV